MFIGRRQELTALEEAYKTSRAELVVLYGRRRVGKSSLIAEFARKKSNVLSFEALEGDPPDKQIRHFLAQLGKQVGDPLISSAPLSSWREVFDLITERVLRSDRRRKKRVLFFDEVQWMAAGRSRLVSLLKYYWDNHWKERGVMLILCGSVASFMVGKVIRSRALYGRITLELLLQGLPPQEAVAIFGDRRSREEILKYLLVFGGVPKYLEDIRQSRSFNHNINRLCFGPNAVMIREMERIFYSQFREHGTYLRIVSQLQGRLLSLAQISAAIGMPSGGGLKRYLEILEDSEIIRSHIPYNRGSRSKVKKYSLADEYLCFHFKYVEPNLRTIKQGPSARLFERLTARSLDPWLGLAFERFCLKHAARLARIMGFNEEVLVASPYFERDDQGFKVDLVYHRSDHVITVCEIKHHQDRIGTKVIPEMKRKLSLLKIPRGHAVEKALISVFGPSQPLQDSEYFDHTVTLDDILDRNVQQQII